MLAYDTLFLLLLREQAGLTQKELGNILGVSDQTVCNWETGARLLKLTIKQTLILCDALNCSLHDLSDDQSNHRNFPSPHQHR
ncbi:MAG TPA: helix-turn-helix transcriptional regulator [Cyanophyceae cyanobacterium]